ncbi:MAG: zf-HC2 domain-containing protein [Acidobacteriota bacterium]|nr:zf-HC2 domain-containing protein [Acidobacteriota bacterium]
MKCDFDKLWLYLNNKLDAKAQMEILEHLSKCEICCQAICQVARDHEADLFIQGRQKQNTGSQAPPEPD